MLERINTMVALTVSEAKELQNCEAIINRGRDVFLEVGTALLTIREQRLYRVTHDTFESYLQERWQMSRPNAYELIGAAVTAKILMSGVPDMPAPTAVSQMRPLAKLGPESKCKVWKQAVKKSEGHAPTAAKVKEAVRAEAIRAANMLARLKPEIRSRAWGLAIAESNGEFPTAAKAEEVMRVLAPEEAAIKRIDSPLDRIRTLLPKLTEEERINLVPQVIGDPIRELREELTRRAEELVGRKRFIASGYVSKFVEWIVQELDKLRKC